MNLYGKVKTMKKLTYNELKAMVDVECMPRLKDAVSLYRDAEAVVVFENQMMDSSQLGQMSFVVVGPSNTFPSVELCKGRWINDLPSQRQHAVAYWLVDAAFWAVNDDDLTLA
jgi:hypothetical protein